MNSTFGETENEGAVLTAEIDLVDSDFVELEMPVTNDGDDDVLMMGLHPCR